MLVRGLEVGAQRSDRGPRPAQPSEPLAPQQAGLVGRNASLLRFPPVSLVHLPWLLQAWRRLGNNSLLMKQTLISITAPIVPSLRGKGNSMQRG